MKKCAVILIFILLLSLGACRRAPDIDEGYIEPVDTQTGSENSNAASGQAPTDTQTQGKEQITQPEPENEQQEITEDTPAEPESTAYDYSQEVDYFADSYDFWNGDSEGATLVSAECVQNDITMSLYIPQGWCYEAVNYSNDKDSFGIYFWPEGEPKGKIYVSFNTGDWELGCGTGIDFNDIRLGNYDATVVTDVLSDINPFMWNYISLLNKTNSVKIWANDAYLWWHKYYDTAIKIMSSLVVDENTCSVYDAITAVEQYTGKIGEFNAGGDYYFDGNYWIIFGKTERYKVTIADTLVVEPIE